VYAVLPPNCLLSFIASHTVTCPYLLKSLLGHSFV
jgi:hypothetical protein